jgi:hypothetical protein
LQNTIQEDRIDEPVVFKREQLVSLMTSVPDSMTICVRTTSGSIIPSQTDDLDGDKKWDELAFLLDFKAGEERTVKLEVISPDKLPVFTKRTNMRLGYCTERNGRFEALDSLIRTSDTLAHAIPHVIQYEGPGWESDKIAFRSYFDNRNGRDLYGKTTSRMVLSTIDSANIPYEKLADWGMDILKVGNSLGAGSLAMFYNDTIHRLGKTGYSAYKLVSNGPVRSILSLTYRDWLVGGTAYNLADDIRIWGGQYYYENQVTLTGNYNGDRDLVTGIGLVHLPDSTYIPVRDETSADINVLYTFGRQSLNNDNLGMAVLLPKNEFDGWVNAPRHGNGDEVTQTTGVKIKTSSESPAQFRFYACWEMTDPVFKTEKGFAEFIKKQSLRFANPIEIKF